MIEISHAEPVSVKLFIHLKHKLTVMEFLKDLWDFLKERKKWWLLPMIIVLLLIGILVVIGGGSAVAPFVYTLF